MWCSVFVVNQYLPSIFHCPFESPFYAPLAVAGLIGTREGAKYLLPHTVVRIL